MIISLPEGGSLIVIEHPLRAQLPTRIYRRAPVVETDAIRQLVESTPAEDRAAVKRFLARILHLTSGQVNSMHAWSNGKLRGKRRRVRPQRP